jgi:hypothetical protein
MKMRIGTSLLMTAFLAVACGDDGSPSAPTDSLDDNAAATATDAAVKMDAAAKDETVDRKDAAAAAAPNTPVDEDATVKAPSEASDAATSGGDAGSVGAGQIDASASDAGVSDASASDAGEMDAGKADAGSAGSTCDTLTYDSFGKTFMTTYCTSCHGSAMAQKNIRLDTLAGVTSAKNKVKAEVASSAMPPRGSKMPSAAERTDLGKWIDCGPK